MITLTKDIRSDYIKVRQSRFQSKEFCKRDEEGHFMTMGSVLLEDITILNVYVLNNTTSKYMEQNLIGVQGETDKSTRFQYPSRNN